MQCNRDGVEQGGVEELLPHTVRAEYEQRLLVGDVAWRQQVLQGIQLPEPELLNLEDRKQRLVITSIRNATGPNDINVAAHILLREVDHGIEVRGDDVPAQCGGDEARQRQSTAAKDESSPASGPSGIVHRQELCHDPIAVPKDTSRPQIAPHGPLLHGEFHQGLRTNLHRDLVQVQRATGSHDAAHDKLRIGASLHLGIAVRLRLHRRAPALHVRLLAVQRNNATAPVAHEGLLVAARS
mmetsp:Transcript_36970/g.98500  ORF Transcript_36970/g.98500 Transcript_36970/m.98500 type:complete len:240 (-) Transcript_36970:118-837(-)